MEKIIAQVMKDLTEDLKDLEGFDEVRLRSKVRNATYEIKRDRNYPKTYTEDMIVDDLELYTTNIYDLALYDYNQTGAEHQTAHSENGISRTWKSRRECKDGVVAFCNSL